MKFPKWTALQWMIVVVGCVTIIAMLAAVFTSDTKPQVAQAVPAQQSAPVVVTPAPTPVIVNNQPAQHSSGVSDFVTGALVGHMLSNNSQPQVVQQPVVREVVREKIIIKQVVKPVEMKAAKVEPVVAKYTAPPTPQPVKPSYTPSNKVTPSVSYSSTPFKSSSSTTTSSYKPSTSFGTFSSSSRNSSTSSSKR